MRRPGRAGLLFLAALAAGWLGCLGPPLVSPEELAAQPIALLVWDREEARRRAEVVEEILQRPEVQKQGVATPDSLSRFLDALDSTPREGPLASLQRWPGRLVLLDPRTGDLQPVEAAPPGARPLAWSPDHRHLLFASARRTGSSQLYEYDVQHRTVRPVTRGPQAHGAADLGAEGRLAFVRRSRTARRSESSRVVVTQAQGRGGRRVDAAPGHRAVRLEPDGRAVWVLRAEAGGAGSRVRDPRLVRVSLAGEEERRFGRVRDLDVAADGSWVVFSLPGRKGTRLGRMRPDGSGRSSFGTPPRPESSPAISPDGRHVAYLGREGVYDFVFVQRMDGSGDRLLFDDGSAAWLVW